MRLLLVTPKLRPAPWGMKQVAARLAEPRDTDLARRTPGVGTPFWPLPSVTKRGNARGGG